MTNSHHFSVLFVSFWTKDRWAFRVCIYVSTVAALWVLGFPIVLSGVKFLKGLRKRSHPKPIQFKFWLKPTMIRDKQRIEPFTSINPNTPWCPLPRKDDRYSLAKTPATLIPRAQRPFYFRKCDFHSLNYATLSPYPFPAFYMRLIRKQWRKSQATLRHTRTEWVNIYGTLTKPTHGYQKESSKIKKLR